MRLSIIIPAHNEAATIREVLEKVSAVNIAAWEKEIIVVNDGSSDNTGSIVESFINDYNRHLSVPPAAGHLSRGFPKNSERILGVPLSSPGEKNIEWVAISHPSNRGKGAGIQTGLQAASGDYIIIQDADAEYDPADIPGLLGALELAGVTLSVPPAAGHLPQGGEKYGRPMAVFGKRGHKAYPERGFHYVVGAWMLTTFFNLLYWQKLTDLYTCYKLIPGKVFKELGIKSTGFEFEAEVACKLARAGIKITETSIGYKPRNKEQGKHIRLIDAVKGFWSILKYRF